ncbi:MAG: hypothetical protein Kow00104_11290 [Rhodothalassiaceae bacterium]
MNARLDFQPIADEGEDSDAVQPVRPARLSLARSWPMLLASALSISWLGAVAFVGWRAGLLTGDVRIALFDLAPLVAGILTPIAVFWLIALVIQRSDPLLERRLGIQRTLDRALAPIEHAEKRLDHLVARMKRDMDHIEAAVDLAASRIDSLEHRFRNEISDLFAATADAEAKSISIKEMLKAEREALAAVDAVIADRLQTLGDAAKGFSATIAAASEESRASASAAASLLDASAEAFVDRAKQAGADITDSAAGLSERLSEIDGLSLEVGHRIETMSERAAERIDAMRAALSALDALDVRLAEAIEERHRKLAVLAETAENDSERVAAALDSAAADSRRATRQAIDEAEAAGLSLRAEADTLGRTLEERLHAARASFDALAHSLASRAQEAEDLANAHAANLLAGIDGALSAFGEKAAELDRSARDAANLITARLDALTNGFADKDETVRKTAAEAVAELTAFSGRLADQAGMIASAAGDAARKMGEAGERMDERTSSLGQILEDMRLRIEEVSGRLETERSALAATSEASASTVLDAAERFRAQSQSLSDHADATSARMRESTDRLFSEIQRIESGGREAAESLASAVSNLKEESEGLIGTLERSSQSLGDAATAFGGERQRILEDTTLAAERLESAARAVGVQAAQLRAAGGETGSELDRIAERFTMAARTVLEMARAAETSARETGDGFEKALSAAVTRGLREVGQSMDTLNTMFGSELNELSERVTKTLDETVRALRRAATEAGGESERMTAQLAEQAERLARNASSFLNKTEEIERRMMASSRDEFVRTSSLLIESLQSASVDIDKILETEVPDDVWQRYLSGDRSIFSRRTVRLGDRGTRGRIRALFDSDREFRDTVLKFFRDFEALMEQVMTRDKHSALSVTLISSEMGKLYVLLAQSLKKLK